MATLQDYLKGVENSGLKSGDWVRVTRTYEDREDGWDNVWPTGVQVGWIGRIKAGDKDNGTGFRVEFGEPINDWYALPYFFLEKVEAPKDGRALPAKSDTDFNVGDYVRIVRKPEPGSLDALGWNSNAMDQNVGKVGCVIHVRDGDARAVYVRDGNNDARIFNGFTYPVGCLEKIEKPDDWTCPQEAFVEKAQAKAMDKDKKLAATKKTFATEDEAMAYAATLAHLDKGSRVLAPDLEAGKLRPVIFTGQYDRDGDPCFLYYDPETKTLKQRIVSIQFIHLPD